MKTQTVFTCTPADVFGGNDTSVSLVLAETPRGEIYIHERRDLSAEAAEKLVAAIEAAGEIDPARWTFWRCIYGSAAQQEEELEAWEWSHMVRQGLADMDAVPDALRSYL